MTDLPPELLERLCMKLCRSGGSLCVGFCHSRRCRDAIDQFSNQVRAIAPDLIAHGRELAEAEGGWVVGNAADTAWRTWAATGPEWTADCSQATRYHRREDAELVHAEDVDAWTVKPYNKHRSKP